MFRAGLLGRGSHGSPIFIVVMCSVVDGIVRGAFFGFYASPCVLAGRSLGDGGERHGFVNDLLVYLLCGSMNMARWSEFLIAINRLLVVKRIVVDMDDRLDAIFTRPVCIAWTLVIFPFEYALGYTMWVDKLFGAEIPCCR